MEMELVLKSSRKSDKNMVKNEAFTDETILTNQQNPIFQGWFLEITIWNYYYQNNREKRYYKLQDFSGDYCAF